MFTHWCRLPFPVAPLPPPSASPPPRLIPSCVLKLALFFVLSSTEPAPPLDERSIPSAPLPLAVLPVTLAPAAWTFIPTPVLLSTWLPLIVLPVAVKETSMPSPVLLLTTLPVIVDWSLAQQPTAVPPEALFQMTLLVIAVGTNVKMPVPALSWMRRPVAALFVPASNSTPRTKPVMGPVFTVTEPKEASKIPCSTPDPLIVCPFRLIVIPFAPTTSPRAPQPVMSAVSVTLAVTVWPHVRAARFETVPDGLAATRNGVTASATATTSRAP